MPGRVPAPPLPSGAVHTDSSQPPALGASDHRSLDNRFNVFVEHSSESESIPHPMTAVRDTFTEML